MPRAQDAQERRCTGCTGRSRTPVLHDTYTSMYVVCRGRRSFIYVGILEPTVTLTRPCVSSLVIGIA